MGRKISQDELNIISSAKYSNTELSKMLNRTTSHINYICKKFDIKLPNHRNLPSVNVNHSFFKEINATSAYILGFIAADGCIYKSKNTNSYNLKIGLSIKDIDLLKNIRDFIAPGVKIHKYKTNFGTESVVLVVTSKEIYDDLVNFGITERKSLTLEWPKNLPEKYTNHFIRGYFDGDGSISIAVIKNTGKNSCIRLSIIGTYNFLNSIKNKFAEKISKNYGGIYEHGNCYELKFGGNISAKLFMNWLYEDSNDFNRLKRKHDIFLNSSQ